MPRYDPQRIEPKWQAYWDERGTFTTPNAPPEDSKGKLYVLDMFPYPSGSGLHVGHPEGYTATDIICRYGRMRGKHVLHPMGWDAFGLPAEQHAIRTKTHPRTAVQENIATFRRQLKMLGFSYDWSRELSTTDENYFRWTQWIFLQLFDTWYDPECEWTGPDGKTRTGRGRPISELPIPDKVRAGGDRAVRLYQDRHRLAYISEAPVNWCPKLGTVLANEEVIDGKSERGGHPVVRIPLRQWMLRIRKYADRLLSELDAVDWPESIKLLQRNWIGRSTGAEVDFFVAGPESADSAFEAWTSARETSGFPSEPEENVLRVYTTRPDTLYGATYMVLAPEHPLVDRLTTADQRTAVDDYREQAARKSDLDRTDLAREKTGVFTGSFAINPVNSERIPIWIADYVLVSYGTGAIMAVPAHDLRDWEFAVQFELPITTVVAPPDDYQPTKEEQALDVSHDPRFSDQPGFSPRPFAGTGTAVNSGGYDGLSTQEFKQRITADLAAQGLGREAVNYRLRDWLFSRQHYWGEPFPIWHELDEAGNPTGLMRADAPEELPVRLPEEFDFTPHGRPEPPLDDAPDDWLYKTGDDGVRLKRETNSMPQWAGSCWYYLRFCDPDNSERFIDPDVENYWMPVDVYIGGVEHAVLHLLYARFWHKVLFDRGHVSTPEPFQRLVNQGMILGAPEFTGYALAETIGHASSDDEEQVVRADEVAPDAWVSVEDSATKALDSGEEARVQKSTGKRLLPVSIDPDGVEKREGRLVLKDHPSIGVESRAFKMSKSRGNIVNPDAVVADYSADALRMYEMFMGPLEQVKPWNMSGVEGVFRFLGRVWRMVVDERADELGIADAVQNAPLTADQERLLHQTIKDVTGDIEKLSFNTAISRLMEFTNAMTACDVRPRAALEPFLLLLSPFAPHIAEELWELLGHANSLAYEPWPAHDEAKLATDEVEIPVQVNGKVRARILVPAKADQAAVEQAARADETVAKNLAGKQIVKTIFVPGRMLNIVVRG
ncbi:MAG: leucine--tRNA ligase [Planctomycetota bacterium]|nr:MAG: leucine--tRNA ligase [Planctomycetota bacterium]